MTVSAPTIVVFTDGGAKGNPGPGGWGAIIVLPGGQVTELGGGADHTTNNRMELSGVIAALRHLRGVPGKVAVYTDSTYVIRGITEWIWGWRKRGWKTAEGSPVLNRDLWETLADLVGERAKEGAMGWHHVPGHAGIPGNERVDEIAAGFATRRPPQLYRGPVEQYAIEVRQVPDERQLPARKAQTARGSRSAAYSYVSVVDGEPRRHANWAECERRVKGRSGARFKKAKSAADEAAILRGWGFSPEAVS